ncbi:RNA polymerase factor sigma-54 [Lapidilactobacillus luobeiensis]|uniref:RNA polymerase factor sigma-54 n=1 Tax=Lapidilactobacillus luobeiensis TaxID=2950371 RepID=UPI0021C371C6|nr:RNA polymerase factor sigma-54 [Lapidilactobacillus luobeiensis]
MNFGQTLNLGQVQSQKLALTQNMRQSILMLQLDTLDLTDYLRELCLDNPFVDVRSNLAVPSKNLTFSEATFQIADHYQSFYDYLLDQVSLTMRDTPLRKIVIFLIETLDANGYITMTDSEIVRQLKISNIALADAKELLRHLDPPGIGACNLRDCLLYQAESDESTSAKQSIIVLKEYFDLLEHHRFNEIQEKMKLTEEEWRHILTYLRTLSASPGMQIGAREVPYILPELKIRIVGKKFSLHILRRGQPEVIFNQMDFDQLSQSVDLDVQVYLKEKRVQYQEIQYNLERRQQTLTLVAGEIVKRQLPFLAHQSEILEPLLLRDVAQTLQLSESTISRAINGKYIDTDRGVFPLKFFFARYSQHNDINSRLSVAGLKAHLKSMVDHEDKNNPMSDQKLTNMLSEQGFAIARRTVTKYRLSLGIPPATQRKKMK